MHPPSPNPHPRPPSPCSSPPSQGHRSSPTNASHSRAHALHCQQPRPQANGRNLCGKEGAEPPRALELPFPLHWDIGTSSELKLHRWLQGKSTKRPTKAISRTTLLKPDVSRVGAPWRQRETQRYSIVETRTQWCSLTTARGRIVILDNDECSCGIPSMIARSSDGAPWWQRRRVAA